MNRYQTAAAAAAASGRRTRPQDRPSSRPPIVARAIALALAAGLALAAPARAQDLDDDPLEPFNRAMFGVNQTLDGMFIKPAAILYRLLVPRPVRQGLGNALLNLASPITLANDLLQGDLDRAGVTLGRFVVNSTVGLLGFVDVGSRIGLPYHYEDFGQTMAVHGVGSGPYLMLPLIGPTNPRDFTGSLLDMFFTPVTYVAPIDARLGLRAAEAVDLREDTLDEVEELRRTSLDFYVAVRTSYQQFRAAEIRNGAPPSADLYEDIYDDLDEDLDEPLEDPADVPEDPADIYEDPAGER